MTWGPARTMMAAVAAILLGACGTSSEVAPATTATAPPAVTAAATTSTTTSSTTTTPTTTTTTSTATTTSTTTVPDVPEVADLDPSLDNGAEGRNTFGDPRNASPAEACADPVEESDTSLVTRVLPDGPRAPDGTLAFTSGLCVYLPPGYATSGLRYPVVFLLHGGGGDASDAVGPGRLREVMDDAFALDPGTATILVMPDGTSGQWYDSADGTVLNATYMLDFVLPYVDQRFRTLGTRDARAILGISNGGYGAMHLASLAPDAFAAAGGLSSNLGALTLAPEAATPDKSPIARAAHLNDVDIILDIASTCDADDSEARCGALVLDVLFIPPHHEFVAALTEARTAAGSAAALQYTEREGSHDWRWWSEWLRDHQLPFVWERLERPS